MAALDLSLSGIVNAAGGLFFVLVGIVAVILAPRARRAQLLGLACIGLGAPLVVTNILTLDRGLVFAQSVMLIVATLLILPLALSLVSDLPARSRTQLAAVGGVLALGLALSTFFSVRDADVYRDVFSALDSIPDGELALNGAAFNAMGTALLFVVAAAAVRSRAPRAAQERRALALLAVGLGAYPLFYLVPIPGLFTHYAPVWFACVLASAAWIGAGDRAIARRATLALQGFALVGVLLWGFVFADVDLSLKDYGLPGAVRTIGAFLILLAILRHDLLGVVLPRMGARRGPLAASAVAALLIVAQVAQNFLSAQLGLVLGGVIAGALVLAARPLERALDRGRARPAPDDAARERSFRTAARRFYAKDGGLTREEERELMLLAEHLGISIARAYEIRDEVERATR